MIALLLALTVTRHLDATGHVCACVSGINPLSTSVIVRSSPPLGWDATRTFPPGTESLCEPLWPPHEGTYYIEARECRVVVAPAASNGWNGIRDCPETGGSPWVHEIELACSCDITDPQPCTGCDSTIYHQSGPGPSFHGVKDHP